MRVVRGGTFLASRDFLGRQNCVVYTSTGGNDLTLQVCTVESTVHTCSVRSFPPVLCTGTLCRPIRSTDASIQRRPPDAFLDNRIHSKRQLGAKGVPFLSELKNFYESYLFEILATEIGQYSHPIHPKQHCYRVSINLS